MPNLFQYVEERGRLSFDQLPFTEADALVMTRLSYLPFEDAVFPDFDATVTIATATERFFTTTNPTIYVVMPEDPDLLQLLAETPRYKDLRLSGYRNIVDLRQEKQFAALTIALPDGSHFLSFRGTDNTLIGWKEDFNMTYLTPVPAQEEAVRYIEEFASKTPSEMLIGGHSKGGNLAMYAGAFCSEPVQNRIRNVYNHDGPALHPNLRTSTGYLRIRDRIQTYIPQSSVVGILMNPENTFTVIDSSQKGIMQHDLYSWEIEHDRFRRMEEMTRRSLFIARTMNEWMLSVENDQRELFLGTMFEILRGTGAETVTDLTKKWQRKALTALKSIRGMDPHFRKNLSRAFRLLFRSGKRNIEILRPRKEQKKQRKLLQKRKRLGE